MNTDRKNTKRRVFFCTVFLLNVFFAATNYAADSVYHTNQGVDFFQDGDFDAAITAFEQAQKRDPSNKRTALNLACALSAAGKTEQAVALFRNLALSRERTIACEALMNLGQIALEKALAIGEQETVRSQAQRSKILTELKNAEKEYSDCLLLFPQHSEARRNLEMVRLWKNRLRESWVNRDHSHREELFTLSEQMHHWEIDQREMRKKLRELKKQNLSPKKMQQLYQFSQEQAALAGELRTIAERFDRDWDGVLPASFPNQNVLKDMRSKMESTARLANLAVRELRDYREDSAISALSTALENWDLVRSRTKFYEQLVRETAELHDPLATRPRERIHEQEEYLWEQLFVLHRIPLILEKAKSEQQELQRILSESPNKNGDAPPFTELDYLFQEIEKSDEELLLESMNLALQYGVEIENQLQETAQLLKSGDFFAARTRQERVNGRFREIIAPLKERENQSDLESDSEAAQNREKFENENIPRNQSDSGSQHSDSEKESERSEENSPNGKSSVEPQKSESPSDPESLENEPAGRDPDFSPDSPENPPRESGRNTEKTTFPENPFPGREVSPPGNSREIAEVDPDQPGNLTPEQQRQRKNLKNTEQEKAETLIRSIKRRQVDAERIRSQLRKMMQPPEKKEAKDW